MAQTDFKPIRKMGISHINGALLGSAAAMLLLTLPLAAQEAGLRRTIDTGALSNSMLQDQNAKAALKKRKPKRPPA